MDSMLDDAFNVLLDLALAEDLNDNGDITSSAIFRDENTTAVLFSKSQGILSGSACFTQVMKKINPDTRVRFYYEDGASLSIGDKVAEISGKAESILTAERTALNFIGYLSGIATITAEFVAVSGSGGPAVLDTRKTLPGFRKLSKKAVADGGGTNHRMGLYDMVMIKDNHIDAAGSIASAVARVRGAWDGKFRIEVECRTISEVAEALKAGADIVMLDNMSPKETEEAVQYRNRWRDENPGKECLIELSGNMSLDRIPLYRDLGADYISVGMLTHSVSVFDFSLKIDSVRSQKG